MASASPRLTWLPISGILAIAGSALIWLFFGHARQDGGAIALMAAASESAAATRPQAVAWIDETGTRSFAEVQQLAASAWQAPVGHGYAALRAGQKLWVRVTWSNPSSRPLRGVVTAGNFFVDRMDAWIEVSDGWRRERTGEKIADEAKRIPGREAAATIEVPAHGGTVAYFCFENATPMAVQPRWWPDAGKFSRQQTRGILAEGVYFGGLFALLGYNLVLWVRLRFADIGYYVFYLGALLGFMLLARGWPAEFGWVLGSPALDTLLVLAMAGTGVFLIQFSRTFLELAPRLPRADRGLRAGAGAMGLLVLGALSISWTDYLTWMRLAVIAVGVLHASLPLVAIGAWRAGVRQAGYFLLIFVGVFAGTLVSVVMWLRGVVETDAGLFALMIGSALEMLMLSLAVTDRFAQVQRRLMEETEQRRAMQEAYASELEDEVRERTHDLEVANVDKDRMLIALGHDLRSPLSALTKRAEQLRQRDDVPGTLETLRGFAGEAAAEGRQMLLLIEDIVLWARLRTGARPLAQPMLAARLVLPVVTLHQPLANRRGVTLTADVPENFMIQTDLVLAQTMVRNLVGNAVKFARSRVEVSVRAAAADKAAILVRDDGPGLPAAVSARLHGKESGAGGGMGLRLSQEIGEAIGATLAVAELAGGGTEICLTLPAHSPSRASIEGGVT
ncbi:MAG: ATP-binding protein [Rariglobus sp.]|jgi:signal transduction histidine kinase|nr:ATP-binding protein [Rariglobus sp.]